MAKKILVVDDEPKIVRLVQAYLEKAGFHVIPAYRGEEALELFKREEPALIVLDLMLPDIDGMDVARTIRRESDVPIIMLTARTEETDRVAGLELGADDYVVKPFNPRELAARVRAVLRRVAGLAKPRVIEAGDLLIDLDSHEVRAHGERVELTPTEFQLLATMAEQPGRVFTRLQLIDALYGTTYATSDRTVDTHIKNLRRKIEPDPKRPQYVLTVHGVGYKFQGEER
jgi:DNA-binding response OmpR family regulator